MRRCKVHVGIKRNKIHLVIILKTRLFCIHLRQDFNEFILSKMHMPLLINHAQVELLIVRTINYKIVVVQSLYALGYMITRKKQ